LFLSKKAEVAPGICFACWRVSDHKTVRCTAFWVPTAEKSHYVKSHTTAQKKTGEKYIRISWRKFQIKELEIIFPIVEIFPL
jgi:hypothetical protein